MSSFGYEIQVSGPLSDRWDGRLFGECLIKLKQGEASTLQVWVKDSAALRGLLNHLWDLNLEILSLKRIRAEIVTPVKEHLDEN